eukprot:scaffold389536_cov16-Prasinocladus_malaysianus.AAC.1
MDNCSNKRITVVAISVGRTILVHQPALLAAVRNGIHARTRTREKIKYEHSYESGLARIYFSHMTTFMGSYIIRVALRVRPGHRRLDCKSLLPYPFVFGA